jgi:CRP-like cAMP-binding protein
MYAAKAEKSHTLDLRLSDYLNSGGADMDILFKASNKIKTREYPAGKILFTEDTEPVGIYILKQGKVKLIQKEITGQALTVTYLGLCSLIRNKKHNCSAEALEDCIIDFIPKQEFFRLLAQYPAFSHKILVGLCKLLDAAEDEVMSLSKGSVREKLAEILLILFKNVQPEEKEKTITASVKDLAGLVGSTPEIIKGYLFEFKEKKYICVQGKKITLLDSSELNKISPI